MIRDFEYIEERCDICGKLGAYDIYENYICEVCLLVPANKELVEKIIELNKQREEKNAVH